jgi:hypothetical protein
MIRMLFKNHDLIHIFVSKLGQCVDRTLMYSRKEIYAIVCGVSLESKIGVGCIVYVSKFYVIFSKFFAGDRSLNPPIFAFAEMQSKAANLMESGCESSGELVRRHVPYDRNCLSADFSKPGEIKSDLSRNAGDGFQDTFF